MEGGRLRLFLGLPLPQDLGEALGQWQRGQPDLVGWTRPEGLHLTLAFLGERPPEALPALALPAAAAARHTSAFELHTAGLGGFPNDRAARVLWLGLEPTLDLAALASDLRGALAAEGETFDPKPFRPHLTLARFRRARPVAAFVAPPPAEEHQAIRREGLVLAAGMIGGSVGVSMRSCLLPTGLAALLLSATPLCAQWDLRLELPRPMGQSLPQTLITGTGQLVAGDLSTGKGFIASAHRQLFQIGPLLKLEAGLEYSRLTADGNLAAGASTQSTTLNQQGVGAGINAQVWVPFVGIAGEIGLIQRFQHYTFDTAGASTAKDLSRTWLRVGARWRIPSVVVHPYLAASYQQPVSKDRPVKLSSASDLAAYFSAQGSGQEFERMWTFGAGVTF